MFATLKSGQENKLQTQKQANKKNKKKKGQTNLMGICFYCGATGMTAKCFDQVVNVKLTCLNMLLAEEGGMQM